MNISTRNNNNNYSNNCNDTNNNHNNSNMAATSPNTVQQCQRYAGSMRAQHHCQGAATKILNTCRIKGNIM